MMAEDEQGRHFRNTRHRERKRRRNFDNAVVFDHTRSEKKEMSQKEKPKEEERKSP
jgi:hypothetical protein